MTEATTTTTTQADATEATPVPTIELLGETGAAAGGCCGGSACGA